MNEKNSEDSKRIVPQVIEDEMKRSYLDYAMSVIIGRALPDARDGLKPVHRRILYAMSDMGMRYNTPFKKSARIVGEVLGKYHPHGDSAVYDTLVRMAQDFSLRYPLILGQGNFGSIDGDNAAAMRYTEAKLSKISDELLKDLEKETVEFIDNFDGTLKEPTILPTVLPNLLVNGSSGIAVGMATNIPPHNLKEVCKATTMLIDSPEMSVKQVAEVINAPDFPTGGIIIGKRGIIEAYATGRGKVKVKSVIEEEEKKGNNYLVVKEIPYMVNKSILIQEIAQAVNDKRIEGIRDLRDESDRQGMRIVIHLKSGANIEVVKNQLLRHTKLQVSLSMIMLALVDNTPKILNIKQILGEFIKHRKEVVIRRSKFDLRKAKERSHILEGLLTALKFIDQVVALLKKSKDVQSARSGLMTGYKLSEAQANAILDMKLQKLTSLEQEKIKEEQNQMLKRIKELEELLASETKIYYVIKQELKELSDKYGDERRTQIQNIEENIEVEDLIKEEAMVVTITNSGYVKRNPLDQYRIQRRGGVGVIGATTKEEDFVERLFVANTHDYLLIFTSKGQVHQKKVYELPIGGRTSKGKAIINLIKLEEGETVKSVIPVKEFTEDQYLVIATKKGLVKKTSLSAYKKPRQGGIIGITLNPGDSVVDVVLTDGKQTLFLASAKGNAVKFDEKDARPIGRTSRGVRGISLGGNDQVVGMILAEDDKTVLTITENGFGKRTPFQEYRLINRGGKGVINIKTTERNGRVVSINSVNRSEEIMIMSKSGIIIRTPVKDISEIGRNTQGVRVMRLRSNDKVTGTAKIVNEELNNNNGKN
ncbi:DNA gyrase subunit A [Candidatus Woesearchaeota archaeon]|nr:DNA gyrase subunit A [Candidatus Woesearchaeota archaeon]